MKDLKLYGENVAAIAAIVHEDKNVYENIYNNLPQKIGGFVGIWSICADAAAVFSEQENLLSAREDFDWIRAIESYAKGIITLLQQGLYPTIVDMRTIAVCASENNSLISCRYVGE